MTDALNPYQSPQVEEQASSPIPRRDEAQAYVHRTLLILIVPALVNLAMYLAFEVSNMPRDLWWLIACFNFIWMAMLLTALWFAAIRLLEGLAVMLFWIFGGSTSRDAWLETMYAALWPMVPAAAVGGLLWVLWLVLYFVAGHPGGFAIDVLFQTAGHLLGGWVYGNVFYHWYLLRRARQVASYS